LQPVRTSAATTTETRNRTGASRPIRAGRGDVRLVDAQGKSAITRSVAGGGDLIKQRTLHFNSVRGQELSRPDAGGRLCRRALAPASRHDRYLRKREPRICLESTLTGHSFWGMAAVRPANVAGSDVAHSSAKPALRRPSVRLGMSSACSRNHLMVKLGLTRKVSATYRVASSVLPRSA